MSDKRTKNSLGKEKVGDKLGKNKPKRLERSATAVVGQSPMKSTMRRTRIRKTRAF